MIDLSGDSPQVAALDFNMARDMAEALHAAYPGHLWAVTCEGEKGIATVRNMYLSGNWGFVLKLKDISTASDWKKKVVMAGGELLERYRLSRGSADQAAIADLQSDKFGNILGDKAK
ncbi:MAG: hypothetical protein WC023_01525 [Rhodocyclaceae bacterium]